jgi:DNA-binding response OmpR family regulator
VVERASSETPDSEPLALLHLNTMFLSPASYKKDKDIFMKRRILLVDDELAILLTLKAVLEISGFEVETAASAREAKLKIRSSQYHMVITDMRMESDHAGTEVVVAAKKAPYRPAVAMLTAFPMTDSSADNPNPDKMLVKPMNTNDLLRQLEALLVSHEDKKRREERNSAATGAVPASVISKTIAGKKKVPAKKLASAH